MIYEYLHNHPVNHEFTSRSAFLHVQAFIIVIKNDRNTEKLNYSYVFMWLLQYDLFMSSNGNSRLLTINFQSIHALTRVPLWIMIC